jgi:hypothetical protein
MLLSSSDGFRWEPFALRISCGPLALRVLRDEDLPELVELVCSGIQDPALPMPFLRAWHEEPFAPGSPDGFPTTSLQWWWTQRAIFAPEEWRLAMVVRREGVLVGIQGVGTGTLMRQLIVGLAFDELGAGRCESGYIVGNRASAAVSRKVGYVDNGRRRIVQHTAQGKVGAEEQRVTVTPATFVRPDGRVVWSKALMPCAGSLGLTARTTRESNAGRRRVPASGPFTGRRPTSKEGWCRLAPTNQRRPFSS